MQLTKSSTAEGKLAVTGEVYRASWLCPDTLSDKLTGTRTIEYKEKDFCTKKKVKIGRKMRLTVE